MACVILPGEGFSWYDDKMATIYGTPITLSALSFNILMGISGGIIGAWAITKDPFWMMSGALAGIIAVASGLDLYCSFCWLYFKTMCNLVGKSRD